MYDEDFGPWPTRSMSPEQHQIVRTMLEHEVNATPVTVPAGSTAKPAVKTAKPSPARRRTFAWAGGLTAVACVAAGLVAFVALRDDPAPENLVAQVANAIKATEATTSYTQQIVFGGKAQSATCSRTSVDNVAGTAVVEQRSTAVVNDSVACGENVLSQATYFADGYFGFVETGRLGFAKGQPDVVSTQLREELLLAAVDALSASASSSTRADDGSLEFALNSKDVASQLCSVPRVGAGIQLAAWSGSIVPSAEEQAGCRAAANSISTMSVSVNDDGSLARVRFGGPDAARVMVASFSNYGETTVEAPQVAASERVEAQADGTACELSAPWVITCPVPPEPTPSPTNSPTPDPVDPVAAVTSAIDETLASQSFRVTSTSSLTPGPDQFCTVVSVNLVDSQAEFQYGATNEAQTTDPCEDLGQPYNTIVSGSALLWSDGGPDDPGLGTSHLASDLFVPAVSMMSNLADLRWDVTAATSSNVVDGQPNTYHFTRDVQTLMDENCGIEGESCTGEAFADQLTVVLTKDGRVDTVAYSFTDRDASYAAAEAKARENGNSYGMARVTTRTFDSYDALPKLSLAGVTGLRAADPGEWTYPAPSGTITSAAGVCEFLRISVDGGCDAIVKRLGF